MPSKPYPSCYDVLGVDKLASADDIRKAYRRRALETHPDKLDVGASEEEKQSAQRQFHKVHEAFEILSDPQKRRTYDARLAMNADPFALSEESTKRMKERFEWAMRQTEQYQKRMEAFRKETGSKSLEQQHPQKLEEPPSEEAKLVAEMLQELYDMNPEVAERRKAVLQRKAEREKAEMRARRTRNLPTRS